MKKIVVYIAESLDGYIATQQDDVEWLNTIESDGDNGYTDFLSGIDTVVMGRRTYNWICKNAPEYPYAQQTSYIVTSSPVAENYATAVPVQEIIPLLKSLRAENGKDIWVVGGGKLIALLLQHNLIDEFRIFIAPLLLGGGIPLFEALPNRIPLALTATKQHGQFIELVYTVSH